jgi:phage protein U
MTLGEALISAWQQTLGDGREDIELEGEIYPVTVSKAKGLRMVEFNLGPYRIVGIEQNPKTGSRWAELAREGNRIMQFRCKGRYVANVCEGKLLPYPAWKALELPE